MLELDPEITCQRVLAISMTTSGLIVAATALKQDSEGNKLSDRNKLVRF